MKWTLVLLSVLLVAWTARGQAKDSGVAAASAPKAQTAASPPGSASQTNAAPRSVEGQTEPESPLMEGKALEFYGMGPAWKAKVEKSTVKGPLTQPFLSKRPAEVPSRLLNLFNPFAPVEPAANVSHRSTVRGLSARSWASVVGWRPGKSEFADAESYEPSMGLLTIECSKPAAGK